MPLSDEAFAKRPVDKPTFSAREKCTVWNKAAFEALLHRGEFAKALALLRHMKKRWPDNPGLLRAVALLESHVEGQGVLCRAESLFEEACQAFLRGDTELARRMFLMCHRMQPDAWLPRFNLSRLGLVQSTELCSAEGLGAG